MLPYSALKQSGLLPLRTEPVRFAVGDPEELTSNSWRIWPSPNGDVYIACRDNFQEVKVSLHTSGRWRVGFTTEAASKNPSLVGEGQNRAWDVWDRPEDLVPDVVRAFQLVFSSNQLVVGPEHRKSKKWKNTIYIEGPPLGMLTVLTVFITQKNVNLRHETLPSFVLANYELSPGCYAQVVAHADPEGDLPHLFSKAVDQARSQAQAAGIDLPETAFGYFLGRRDDGTRYIFGAPA
jgi:hypothetical protein